MVAVDPFDAQSHATLGQLAMKAGDTAEAIRSFRVAVASKPLDRASAHADLAEALLAAGQKDEARKQVMEALMVAPTFTRAQDLLLKLSRRIAVMRRWIWATSLAAAVLWFAGLAGASRSLGDRRATIAGR